MDQKISPDVTALTAGSEARDDLGRALDVLQLFCECCRLPFDRQQASRSLWASMTAFPGRDSQTWARRLMEVGETLELHIRMGELSLGEVWKLAREGVPVATLLRSDNESQWLIIKRVVRGRALIWTPQGEHWRRRGAVARDLRKAGVSGNALWFCGQAALPSFAGNQEARRLGDRPLSPFRRLLYFLRPELRDLWILLLFSSVIGILGLATPIAVESLVNMVAFGQTLQPVIILSLLLFVALGFAASLRAIMVVVVEVLQRRLFVRVVEDLAFRLPRVPHAEWDHHNGPELVNRFFDIVTVQKVCATLFLDGLSIVLQALLGMLVLAFYHPYLLGFDIILLMLMVLIIFVMGKNGVRTAIQESQAKYRMAHWLEQISHLPTAFKYHRGAQLAADFADQLAVNYLEQRRRHFAIVLRQVCFALLLQALAATALLGLGGWLVIQGQLTLGQLVAAELIVTVIVGTFTKAGKHLESFYDLMASMDKLGHLFDLPLEPHERLFHFPERRPACIRVQDVVLGETGHHGDERDHGLASRDGSGICLEALPGEALAIVGPTGSGKSRLLEILAGLRSPMAGHVELDDIDYRELRPDALREHLGFCRDVEIFEGTLLQNLDLHRQGVQVNDVRQALISVNLHQDVRALPKGMNTVLSPSGAPLSRGQAVKLMLARAIVGKPRLLLVDATLDLLPTQEARQILEELLAPDRPWTLIMSTARSELAGLFDRQYMLATVDRPPEPGDLADQVKSDSAI